MSNGLGLVHVNNCFENEKGVSILHLVNAYALRIKVIEKWNISDSMLWHTVFYLI